MSEHVRGMYFEDFVEEIRKAIEEVEQQEQDAKQSERSESSGNADIERLEARKAHLVEQLAAAEKKRKEASKD